MFGRVVVSRVTERSEASVLTLGTAILQDRPVHSPIYLTQQLSWVSTAGFLVTCRACSRCLLVLDDCEFYEAQTVLRLEQFRAIAAALNSLVYHSHVRPAIRIMHHGTPGTCIMLYSHHFHHWADIATDTSRACATY